MEFVASGPGGSDTAASSESITVKPGPLVKVSIDPEAVTLQVQETAQLQARTLDQFDNLIGNAVLSWVLIGVGGTIDETGLITAGTEAGIYEGFVRLTATQDARSQKALVDATVTPGNLSSASWLMDTGSVAWLMTTWREPFPIRLGRPGTYRLAP